MNDQPKVQTWQRMLSTSFPLSFVKIRSAALEKKSEMRKLTADIAMLDCQGALEPSVPTQYLKKLFFKTNAKMDFERTQNAGLRKGRQVL